MFFFKLQINNKIVVYNPVPDYHWNFLASIQLQFLVEKKTSETFQQLTIATANPKPHSPTQHEIIPKPTDRQFPVFVTLL